MHREDLFGECQGSSSRWSGSDRFWRCLCPIRRVERFQPYTILSVSPEEARESWAYVQALIRNSTSASCADVVGTSSARPRPPCSGDVRQICKTCLMLPHSLTKPRLLSSSDKYSRRLMGWLSSPVVPNCKHGSSGEEQQSDIYQMRRVPLFPHLVIS